VVTEFNPYLPEFHANPYPFYHQLRAEDPVHRSALGPWLIARYADAYALLRDRRLGRDFGSFLDAQMGPTLLRQMLGRTMLFNEPPDHTRLRTLVSKAFTPRVVEGMAPRIRAIVDELLDRVAGASRIDVIADLAYPLPVIVISEILGIPREDDAILRGWSRDFAQTLEFVLTPEILDRGNAAAHAATDYFHRLIRERRRQPRADMLTRLIQAEEHGQKLTEDEIIVTCVFLFGAGHETTTGLIGNAMLALFRHPDQWRRLVEDPTLMRSAVSEFLRYDSSVQMAGRVATANVEIGGRTITAGEVVVVLLGAANRDPARFPHPDSLDVARADNDPLSFGGGIHHCLGAALGRLEIDAAIGSLARRLPQIAADIDLETVTWRDTVAIRGLQALPARV
jgi:cytochrome P450